MAISRQEEADKSLRKGSVPHAHAEAAVPEAALRTATSRILGW